MLNLKMKAELNGVTDLVPFDTEERPFYYSFQVQCTSCREIHPNYIGVSQWEIRPLSTSRGEANFVWRCKNCQREASANIKSGPVAYVQAEPATEQTLLTFECRGCDFVDFKPEGEWTARGIEKGGEFPVDLSDGDWYDYDEKVRAEVSIVGVQFRITR